MIRFGRWKRGEEMSYLLPHLHSGWAVDQVILVEEERLVIIRFGQDWDETCMQVASELIEQFFSSDEMDRVTGTKLNAWCIGALPSKLHEDTDLIKAFKYYIADIKS